MCLSCCQHVDVHKEEGISLMWTGEGFVNLDFLVDIIHGWPLEIVVNWQHYPRAVCCIWRMRYWSSYVATLQHGSDYVILIILVFWSCVLDATKWMNVSDCVFYVDRISFLQSMVLSNSVTLELQKFWIGEFWMTLASVSVRVQNADVYLHPWPRILDVIHY